MYWTSSATRTNAPISSSVPTMKTSRGIIATRSRCGSAAKYEKIMKAVALVGPRMVKRELRNSAPTMPATAAQVVPNCSGSPAMAA